MNPFLKILVAVALAFAVVHLFPIALVPFAVLGLILLVVFGAVSLLVGAGLVGCVVALSLLIAVVAALSPLWVPVLLIVGIISLCRRNNGTGIA